MLQKVRLKKYTALKKHTVRKTVETNAVRTAKFQRFLTVIAYCYNKKEMRDN